MSLNQVTPADAVILLNEALQADRDAIKLLFAQRVECNEKLAFHPTIQVKQTELYAIYSVGFLGLLNGIFGINENMAGFICAVYEGDQLVRFALTPDQEKAF